MRIMVLPVCIFLITFTFRAQDQTINGTTFKVNGELGLGTIDPDAKLVIGNIGSNDHVKMIGFGEGPQSAIWFQSGFSGQNEHNYIELKSSYGNIMTWTRGTGIGLGTVLPDSKLAIGNIGPNDTTRILGFGEGNESIIWFQSGFSPSNGANYIQLRSSFGSIMTWKRGGFVGIGTTTPDPDYKLSVNGAIKAKEIKVETGWSDFVFEKGYQLPTLEEVAKHIAQKGHLKDIPSAAEVEKEGIFLGEMDAKLLQKIEELTLYIIEQDKTNKEQAALINKMEKRIKKLEKR